MGEQQRLGREQRLDLVEERGGGVLPGLRAGERGREARDRVGLAAALGGLLLGLVDAPARGYEQAAVVPADEDEHPRHGHRGGREDDQPGGLVREDVAVGEREPGDQRRQDRDDGEEQPDAEAEHRRAPLAQQRDADQDREEAVEHGQDQKWDGVQQHRLTVGSHRASRVDDRSERRATAARRTAVSRKRLLEREKPAARG